MIIKVANNTTSCSYLVYELMVRVTGTALLISLSMKSFWGCSVQVSQVDNGEDHLREQNAIKCKCLEVVAYAT